MSSPFKIGMYNICLLCIFILNIFIFILLIINYYGNYSFAEYYLLNSNSSNISMERSSIDYAFLKDGIFAVFYKNELEIKQLHNKNKEIISVCSFGDIQLSENKSCGNITGLNDIDKFKENSIKIINNLNIILVITLILLLISSFLIISMIKNCQFSNKNKNSNSIIKELALKNQKNQLNLYYFNLSFNLSLLPFYISLNNCMISNEYSYFKTSNLIFKFIFRIGRNNIVWSITNFYIFAYCYFTIYTIILLFDNDKKPISKTSNEK